MSRTLLWGLVCVALGCSSKPPEQQAVASHTSPLVVVGWEGTGPMAEARKYHAGVELGSGKVLVVGGYNASGFLSSATVYEPGTGTWTAVASMPAGRQAHTATVLSNGKVLVAGGENATGRLASSVVYDPVTDSWASGGNFASGVARDLLTAVVLPQSGKVLVAGGGNSAGAQNKVDVYDPVTGTWAVGPAMRTARRSHTATVLANGKVLVVGGWSGGATGAAEVYDPATNTWSATGALATARYDHTATLLPSGKVLVVGGRNGTNGSVMVGTAEVYEPSTGQWSAAGALSSARAQHTATRLGTGKVLVVGGLNGSAGTSALASAEVYDSGTGQWSAAGVMGSARYLHVAVGLEALGKVVVVGGVGATGSSQKTAELYVYDLCEAVTCNSSPGQCYEAAGTCAMGVCSYAPKASGASCDDGNACTGADACNGAGVCAGTATSCSSPPGQCYEVAGTCSSGSCEYEYKEAGEACDDGDACTVAEVCNGAGGCAGTPVSCNSPPGQCYEAAGTCSEGACSYAPKAAGTACNDGNAGTINDVCSGAGVCGGVPACTTPPSACHESPGTYANGACTYPLKATGTSCGAGQICTQTGTCEGKCWIGGTLYEAGTINPSGVCQECNPSVSTSSWSFRPSTTQCRASGGTCDVAEYCTGNSSSCPGDGSAANGTSCGTSQGAWGSCGGFSDFCDTTGTQTRTVTASTCGNGVCSASSTSTETQACTRVAPGPQACAAPSYGAWSACSFSNVCAQTGTQTRTVTSHAYDCASGQCVASTSTETQSCTRNTNGNSCGSTSGGCTTCSGFSDICDETGTQSCSTTNYTCSGGTCSASSTSTQTVACTVSKAGTVCDSSESCGACSFGDYCTTQGSQSCSESYSTCSGGSCRSAGSSNYSQACYRAAPSQSCSPPPPTSYGSWSGCSASCGSRTESRTVTTYSNGSFNCSTGTCPVIASSYTETRACPTVECPATSYGSWSSCSGFSDYCDTTGTQSRTVTSYFCNGTSCVSSSSTETQACTRSAPGPQSCSPTYGSWSACSGFSDACDTTGTQSRQVTNSSYSCSAGACQATSTSTETQSCSRSVSTPPRPADSQTLGPCEGFSSMCDETGTQTLTVTTYSYSCASGSWVPSSSSTTQSCSRSTSGQTCGSPIYGGWSSCGGFGDTCGEWGNQSRTATTYTCSSGACIGSTTTENQSCTRNTDGVSCQDNWYCTTGDRCWDGSCQSGNWAPGCIEP